MTTNYYVPSAEYDGCVEGRSATWVPDYAAIDTTSNFMILEANRFSATDYEWALSLMYFDTSAIPDDAVVSAATVNLYCIVHAHVDSKSIQAQYYDSGGVYSTDYQKTPVDASAVSAVAISTITEGAYTAFTLLSLSNIWKQGYTGLRWSVSDVTTPTGENGLQWGAFSNTYPPYLSVTYSSIKTINGLAVASVSTINGLAVASVGTVNGLVL